MRTTDKIMLGGALAVTAYLMTRPKQSSASINHVIAKANASPLSQLPITLPSSVYGIPTAPVSGLFTSIWNGVSGLFSQPSSADVIYNFSTPDLTVADVPEFSFGSGSDITVPSFATPTFGPDYSLLS